MKNKIILFLFIHFVASTTTNAQNNFMKHLYANWCTTASNILKADDGSIFISNDYAVIKTDSMGNYLWGKYFVFRNQKMLLGSDGNIYIGGMRNNIDSVFIAKIDTAGNLLWRRSYYAYPGNVFQDLIFYNDTTLFLSVFKYNDSLLTLLRINTLGDVMKGVNINLPTGYNGIWGGLQVLNDTIRWYNTIQLLDSFSLVVESYVSIMELDSNYNLLSSKKISISNYDAFVRFYQDGELSLIEINNYNGIHAFRITPVIVAIDNNYQVKWSHYYGGCNASVFDPMIVGKYGTGYIALDEGAMFLDSIGNIIGTTITTSVLPKDLVSYNKDSSGYYVAGGSGSPYTCITYARCDSTFMFNCISSNSFNLCNDTVSVLINPISFTFDSSNATTMVSDTFYVWPTPPQTYISCPTSIEESTDLPLAKVFPNPNDGSFSIVTEGEIRNVRIYDLNGRQIYNVVNPESSLIKTGLPNGVFQLVAIVNNSLCSQRITILK